jgi:uncharacterized protein (TIGR02147 family)
MNLNSIFDYLDYREFLKDHYEANKARNPFHSFRFISSKTGLDSSFYVKVLQKQMHLSLKSLPCLINFLNLNKKESEYFTLLVRFNRADKKEEMKRCFENIIEFRNLRTNTLDAKKYEYFSKWYYVVIRELLNFTEFDGNYKALAMKLNPPISESEAKKAIDLLCKLGLIRKNNEGFHELTEQFVTTGESWNSIAVENFQREMLHLAEDSINNIQKNNRETSTITVSISWECFKAMKERLREVRKELLEMAKIEREPDGVFQINFQIFPLTSSNRGKVEQ